MIPLDPIIQEKMKKAIISFYNANLQKVHESIAFLQ